MGASSAISSQSSTKESIARSRPKFVHHPASGAPAGLPMFLHRVRFQPRITPSRGGDAQEWEAQRAGEQAKRGGLSITNSGALRSSRIHSDVQSNRIAASFGANALTIGRDIYFNAAKYQPGTPDGDRLLAHELTHVEQQRGQPARVQCDLMSTMPTALGWFEIDMATRAAPRPGMEGHIRFAPDPSGPYSAQIGLVQIVNVTDIPGRTTPTAGAPVDWNRVGGGGERGRQDLMTRTTLTGPPAGWFVDAQTAAHAAGSDPGPNYIEQWGLSTPTATRRNYFGWLRSPTDWQETSLYDYPWFSFDVDFQFETVAKATDTQAIYGALEWGFGIRSRVVQGEYARAVDTESATFTTALERFRGYYTHEPIVLYFDTSADTPMGGEVAKIAGVLDYLGRYSDVQVRIEGYADDRGSILLNNDLSQRRADNVRALAIALGISASRIEYAVGGGPTDQFAAGANAGTRRANRRVVMSFVRTASAPIVP
jgi:outer membrane protein OmpA-like peptidoglycan-associated protein